MTHEWTWQAEIAALRKENERLRAGYGILWRALAEIVEIPGFRPNATVQRMARIAEQALLDDPVSTVKPVPRFARADLTTEKTNDPQ